MSEVKKYADHDNRVSYLGYLPPSEVEKYQRSATVLINPRTSEHVFVKYSFPSKNMECLASGKPLVAYKLDGVPYEYDEYVHYVPEDVDAAVNLKEKIDEVCAIPLKTRERNGEKAKRFVLEKSPVKQCEKVLDMLRTAGI